MKSIIEWYQQLPEPIRSQAIENATKYFGIRRLKTHKESSLRGAISSMFDWGKTPQGGSYWCEVDDRIASGEFDKQD